MSLQEQLDTLLGQAEDKRPPEWQAIIDRTIEDLRRSSPPERSIKVGDGAPEFALTNTTGRMVQSPNCSSRDPSSSAFIAVVGDPTAIVCWTWCGTMPSMTSCDVARFLNRFVLRVVPTFVTLQQRPSATPARLASMPFRTWSGTFGPALRPGLSASTLHSVIPYLERSGRRGRMRASFLPVSPSALLWIDPYPS